MYNDKHRCQPCYEQVATAFSFFSNERQEPAHIHVKAGDDEAKFWLDTIELASNYGFKPRELNEIKRIVLEHQAVLMEAWNEYFG